MALKRAAFSLRRRRSLGFSKCRWLRTSFKVPSRSIFFFNRRSALSTDSPFLSLISVKSNSHPLRDLGHINGLEPLLPFGQVRRLILLTHTVNRQKLRPSYSLLSPS